MRFNFRSQTLGHYVDVSIVYPTDNIAITNRIPVLMLYPWKENLKYTSLA